MENVTVSSVVETGSSLVTELPPLGVFGCGVPLVPAPASAISTVLRLFIISA